MSAWPQCSSIYYRNDIVPPILGALIYRRHTFHRHGFAAMWRPLGYYLAIPPGALLYDSWSV